MDFDGSPGHKPAIAMDVYDIPPEDWPEPLLKHYADVVDNPANWAKKCAEFGADLICLKLDGIHPDKGNISADETVSTVKSILEAVDIPLIIWGCENDERDNEIMPKVSEAAKGEKCLLGGATQENYKTITAVCLADGHNLITQAPVDINIGKQINILVTDLGFPTDRIVMFQTTVRLDTVLNIATLSMREEEWQHCQETIRWQLRLSVMLVMKRGVQRRQRPVTRKLLNGVLLLIEE